MAIEAHRILGIFNNQNFKLYFLLAKSMQVWYIQEGHHSHAAIEAFAVYRYLANLVLLTHPRAGTSRLLIALTLSA